MKVYNKEIFSEEALKFGHENQSETAVNASLASTASHCVIVLLASAAHRLTVLCGFVRWAG